MQKRKALKIKKKLKGFNRQFQIYKCTRSNIHTIRVLEEEYKSKGPK